MHEILLTDLREFNTGCTASNGCVKRLEEALSATARARRHTPTNTHTHQTRDINQLLRHFINRADRKHIRTILMGRRVCECKSVLCRCYDLPRVLHALYTPTHQCSTFPPLAEADCPGCRGTLSR
jgi:hypothetical protein